MDTCAPKFKERMSVLRHGLHIYRLILTLKKRAQIFTSLKTFRRQEIIL
jgi:hypothetical protein